MSLNRRALCAFAGILSGIVALALPAQAQGRPELEDRRLFLVLDAVPYSAVAALEAEGSAPELFGELGKPVPLISSFPSTTTVALAAALGPLGLEISPGYEARFFDWQQEKVRGGGMVSYFRIEFPWRDFFQWSRKGVARSALASLRPVGASHGRVRSAFEAFLASDQRDFFAYVETTDTAVHLKGPASLDQMFRELGLAIRAARSRGERFKVAVLSDHGVDGGEPLINVLPGIVSALEHAGSRLGNRLRHPSDVVLTPYGLVSSFEAYAREEEVPELASRLAGVDGVALCVHRSEAEIRVVSEEGAASIARRGDEWAYRQDSADPLGYANLSRRMSGARTAPGESSEGHELDRGWYSDRHWFEASKNEFYPDALHRIARGFELVGNPASVICSVEPGYMYGARKTERAARLAGGRLRWTHGALHWEASAGFLLTDLPGATGSGGLRLSEALVPLVSSTNVHLASLAARASATRDARAGTPE